MRKIRHKNEVRVHVTLHTVTANIFFYSQRTMDKEAIVTLREASGCSGPSRLQWKAARSSSGKIWFPERKKFLTFCCISEQKQQTKAAVNYNQRTGVCPSKVRSVVYSLDFEVCAIVSLLTQQSSKAGQVLCLEPELPGGLGQQILVCGQVLSVPAQFERMRGKVGGDVAEGKLWILSDQACKSIVPVEREHFLVVVLQSLYNL